MKTIAFSSLKGGVGKSSLAIMTATALGKAGKRVLVIDADVQNATSFYFLQDPGEALNRNLARAIMEKDLKGNIVTGIFNDIVPSSLALVSLRSCPLSSISAIKNQVSKDYDFLIIDTSPTIDNIVLACVQASDLVVIPVRPSLFDWKTAGFYLEQVSAELGEDVKNRLSLLFNFWTDPRTENPDADAKIYEKLFIDLWPNILENRIPASSLIQKFTDGKQSISTAERSAKLFRAVASMVQEITGEPLNVERF